MNVDPFFHDRYGSLLRWSWPFAWIVGLDLRAQGPVPVTDVSQSSLVSDAPEVRSPFLLHTVNDPDIGKSAFSFEGQDDPPEIRNGPPAKTAA